MSDKKLNDKSGIFLVLVGCILVAGSIIYYLSGNDSATAAEAAAPSISAPVQGQAPQVPIQQAENAEFNVKTALAPRTLGDDNAPVKIHEFASLTCGHCGQFHNTTLQGIKEKYVDTGKVQFIFTDFPLNEGALMGTQIARCLPADQYYPFVTKLFAEQDKWAYNGKHKESLINYAKPFGLTEKQANTCLNNKALKEGIITSLQANARQWQINSTPSFLINNKEVVSGGLPTEKFAELIEKYLAE